jgi:hypothetical protein
MVEILVALFLAFIVIWGITTFVGEGGGKAEWPIFLLFFLAILAGGLWMTPVGPPVVGVYFIPFLLMAIVIALFWFAAPPPPRRKRRTGESPSVQTVEDDTRATAAGMGVLFWFLLVGLVMVVLFAYVASSTRVVAQIS